MIFRPIKQYSVLIMGYIWPEITSSAASLRIYHLIQTFQKYNFNISFSSSAKQNQHTHHLQSIFPFIKLYNFQLNCNKFNVWLKEQEIDFILFDRYLLEEQFGWRVFTESPKTIRILDTQDIHFLRSYRENLIKNENSFHEIINLSKILQNKNEICIRELSSIVVI